MNEFIDLLEGTFANKTQAQSHPTRYAHIRVQHRKIADNRFYGEQAYNYLKNRPYRQFVIEVVDEGEDAYRLKNYEVKDALRFAECKNIDQITIGDRTGGTAADCKTGVALCMNCGHGGCTPVEKYAKVTVEEYGHLQSADDVAVRHMAHTIIPCP